LVRLVRGRAACQPRQVKVNSLAHVPRYSTQVSPNDNEIVANGEDLGPLSLKQVIKAKYIWRHIKRILCTPNLAHVNAIERKDVRAWYDFVSADDFRTAAQSVQCISEVPIWALIYAFATKVHSEDDAHLAVTLALQNLAKFSEADQPAILIQTAQALSKHQQILSIPPLLDEFLQLHMPDAELQFDLLLRSLSRFKQSSEQSKNIIRVLEAMRSRGLRIRTHSYNAMLANRFVTMELTTILQTRMREEGHAPTKEQLEAFLRIFGRRGFVHAAARYFNMIRHLLRKEHTAVPAPLSAENMKQATWANRRGAATRYNTEFMRSLVRYPGSAFHYLHSLLDGRSSVAKDVGTSTGLAASLKKGLRSQSAHRVRRQLKTQVDIYDWTTTLHAASMDRKLPAEKLISLFEESKNTQFKPTVATYTTVIRGLIRKGAGYAVALKLWREMCGGLTRLDKVAMTVGMEVLVGSGNALEAFQYIKDVTSPEARVARGRLTRRRFYGVATKPQVDKRFADTILLNSFMSTLIRFDRPDVVFLLWDGMKEVFGLQPDAVTLACVLKAARKVHHLDHSFQAAMGQLNVMMGRTPRSAETLRDGLLAEIESKLATKGPGSGGKKSAEWMHPVSSQWQGVPAGTKAIAIFCAIVCSHWPRLRSVELPARANWSDVANSASAIANLVRSVRFPSRSGNADDRTNTSQAVLPAAPNPYACLIPDERTFAAYIALLGAQNCASEIPLALAWMRELDIIPTQDTISLSLALWAEVSLRGPLVEQFAPDSTKAYTKLANWLVEWLGSAKLPSECRLARMFRILKQEREGRQ
jgi:hypothetical protein